MTDNGYIRLDKHQEALERIKALEAERDELKDAGSAVLDAWAFEDEVTIASALERLLGAVEGES